MRAWPSAGQVDSAYKVCVTWAGLIDLGISVSEIGEVARAVAYCDFQVPNRSCWTLIDPVYGSPTESSRLPPARNRAEVRTIFFLGCDVG